MFSNGVTEAWPIMFFGGECMPDLFHSSKAPRDLCLTQDLDEIVNTQGGHDLQKSLHIKKNQPYTKWVKHVAKQMHLIANVGFKETG